MAHLDPIKVQERTDRFGKLDLIDEIVRQRGKDVEQVPILGYPREDTSANDYEFFTGKKLDSMVDEACRAFVRRDGFKANEGKTIALYAPSDLPFVVAFFALFRMGYKVLTISTRLGSPACLNLLERCGCTTVLHGHTPRITATLVDLAAARPDLAMRPMLQRADFDVAEPGPPFERVVDDREAECKQAALTMHSSGSTGLPKPLVLSHRGLLTALLTGTEWRAFNPLPWYHLHGLITSLQAMYLCKPACLLGVGVPLTADHLVTCLQAVQPEICHMVPYALKLVAEKPEGVALLKQCYRVTAAGARTPDELGDRLIAEGVNFGVTFGLTEVGHMGDSIHRQPGDDSWDYIRPYPHILPHMRFVLVDRPANVYESVYLESHPALMISNSNDPPGSYHSNDLFTPHPTLLDAWKYVARADDRITLISGEKILPLAIEGAVRESPLVRDVLMVGNDRLVPGLLVFRAAGTFTTDLPDDEFVRALWPVVEEANRMADEFARITPDMILPLAPDVEFPATDKNNIIRAAAYRVLAETIDTLYGHANNVDNGGGESKNLRLGVSELTEHIMRVCREYGGIEVADATADFFAAGVDSLRASQMRRLLQRDLDLGGQLLPTNVVYDAGNAQRLASVLFAMRTGQNVAANGRSEGGTDYSDDEAEMKRMSEMIEKYTPLEPRRLGTEPRSEGDVVLLTGATGAIAAHVLHQLLSTPTVSHVYCLVRGVSPLDRIDASLETRGLARAAAQYGPSSLRHRLTALSTSSLDAPYLGLSPEQYAVLQCSVTHIIHAAWPVHFRLSLGSFEPHVAGLWALLNLALRVPHASGPARFIFASSISAAFETPGGLVAEGPVAKLSYAAHTGYARSKLVGERVCEAAASDAGADIVVLRIGQVTGDTERGIWNDAEAVPLMIRSARELGVLPLLNGEHGVCDWVPLDVCAAAILELGGLKTRGGGSTTEQGGVNGTTNHGGGGGGGGVNGYGNSSKVAKHFNILPPHAASFSWNNEFLPALRDAGLPFDDAVPFAIWLDRLRTHARDLGPKAEARLPTSKLADYYAEVFGETGTGHGGSVAFAAVEACRLSPTLRECPTVVKSGLVGKMVKIWLRNW